MRLYGIRAGKFAVEPDPIWFVEVCGCFHGPSCIVLKMLQVFMRVSGGEGKGLWIPLKIAEI